MGGESEGMVEGGRGGRVEVGTRKGGGRGMHGKGGFIIAIYRARGLGGAVAFGIGGVA